MGICIEVGAIPLAFFIDSVDALPRMACYSDQFHPFASVLSTKVPNHVFGEFVGRCMCLNPPRAFEVCKEMCLGWVLAIAAGPAVGSRRVVSVPSQMMPSVKFSVTVQPADGNMDVANLRRQIAYANREHSLHSTSRPSSSRSLNEQ